MKKLVWTLIVSMPLVLPLSAQNLARAEKHQTNACGCYSLNNTCFCEKKAKCGCPGECEPKGCEEDRTKQMQKEIEEETRKAKEAEKTQSKPKEEGKPAADADEDGAKAAKAKDAHKMTPAQKKQLSKLLEAYLAEHPEAANLMLSEIRGTLE
jgi:hypothetical protein